MDKTESNEKKCYCARCFLPVDQEDRVDIEGQNFHRICSTCCVCRTIPASLKMFYGHVFCDSCFRSHVMSRLKNDSHLHSNSFWMQWAQGQGPKGDKASESAGEGKSSEGASDEPPKRGICARCLQPVDEKGMVQIGDQSFHKNCAQCYFCHSIPKSNVKIYYGQVFCEECFHRHVLNRSKDNPSEFFRNCFESWQHNAQFAENMRDFMAGNRESSPLVFMMQGPQAPFCRCGTGPSDWFQTNEPKKSATTTPATFSIGDESLGTVELSFENRTEVSDIPELSAIGESANQENFNVDAAEKIAKLMKYLHDREDCSEKDPKKWKNFIEQDYVSMTSDSSYFGWIDLQHSSKLKCKTECPKCLWQCGPIFVNSEDLKKQVVCGDILN